VNRPLPLPALAAAATLVLAAAGCGSGYGGGGSSSSSASGGGKTVSLSADPGGALKFDKSKVSVDSGTKTVTVQLKNPTATPHAIASGSQKGQLVSKGGTSSITLTGLKDGTYQLYCPVPGHAAAGMKATLVVGSGGSGGSGDSSSGSGGSGGYGY